MTAQEFYKQKTKHDLKKDCGIRITGEELFDLMTEFAYVMMNDFTSRQSPITDADIEAWAKTIPLSEPTVSRKALIRGAKAYRDNEIKHIEK
jgi:hypothetical protein